MRDSALQDTWDHQLPARTHWTKLAALLCESETSSPGRQAHGLGESSQCDLILRGKKKKEKKHSGSPKIAPHTDIMSGSAFEPKSITNNKYTVISKLDVNDTHSPPGFCCLATEFDQWSSSHHPLKKLSRRVSNLSWRQSTFMPTLFLCYCNGPVRREKKLKLFLPFVKVACSELKPVWSNNKTKLLVVSQGWTSHL